MIVFICMDDNKGMLFNHRRQSRDKVVLKDMLLLAGEKIWMNSYSSKLFNDDPDQIIIEDNLIESVPLNGYCFLEDVPLRLFISKLECIVAYYWNRVYPADTYLDIDLERDWEIVNEKDFRGNSHEKITRKIFKRKI